MAEASRIDLRKRNDLIASLLADTPRYDPESLLSQKDREAIAAAYEAEKIAPPRPAPQSLPEMPEGFEEGDEVFDVNMDLAMEFSHRYLGGNLNFAPLFSDPEAFDGKSGAWVFEELLRRHRAAEAGPTPTVDVRRFYDGNGDRKSVAPNVVDSASGPSFELLRDTLLAIGNRPGVAAVGVEIHEIPNEDNPADDDQWLSAERVFIWTTDALKTVRAWVKPLRTDGVSRVSAKEIAPPPGATLPKGSKVYALVWD